MRAESLVSGPLSPRAKAFELFMKEQKRPVEIATELGLELSVVVRWFASNRWLARKKEQDQVSIDINQHTHKTLIAEEKVKVAKEHLIIGENLEKQLVAAAKELEGSPMKPRELKDLADAVASATAIRARVVGISDKLPQENGGNLQPQALLIIGAPPPQPAGPQQVEAIEVNEQ